MKIEFLRIKKTGSWICVMKRGSENCLFKIPSQKEM